MKSLIYEESGQDLVEYALLMAFIALVCILGMQQLGTAINTTYGSVNTSWQRQALSGCLEVVSGARAAG